MPNAGNLTPGSKPGRNRGASRCLRNFRQVWADPVGGGKGPTIEALRERFYKDPLAFGKELQAMEAAWRRSCRKPRATRTVALSVPAGNVVGRDGAGSGGVGPVPDAGTLRALALIAECEARLVGEGGVGNGGSRVQGV